MNPINRDISCLEHIRNYCLQIEDTCKRFGIEKDIFMSDPVYKNAVALCILQIGELAGNLSEEYRKQHTEIPWSQIKAVRNIVAHSYGTVDAETLWEIIQEDIPDLKCFCDKELNNIPDGSSENEPI